jgi:hypothetical protein
VIAPEKIICVGLNYRRHALEAGFPVPTTPVIFGKFANSLAGSGTSVALPDVDTKYDFEAELGVIIGRAARNVPVEAALDYVAGYCCANDLSARGAQLATSQWMIGKMLDGFLPLGPYLVTADTVKDPNRLAFAAGSTVSLEHASERAVLDEVPKRRRSGLKRECLRDFGLTWPDLRYSARTIMVALVRVEELRPLTLVTARLFPLPCHHGVRHHFRGSSLILSPPLATGTTQTDVASTDELRRVI